MRIRTLTVGQPVQLEAEAVLVTDDYGNPLIVALQTGQSYRFASLEDPQEFQRLLHEAGYHRMPPITDLTPKPLGDITFG